MLRASEGLEVLIETGHVHRGVCEILERTEQRLSIDVGSQRATAQPEVKFASSKPSMTLSADRNWLPPTFGGIPSGAIQVPQLANTQKQ